jgi:hypothetical protein
MIGLWKNDNCLVTHYNAPRKKYGVVGNYNESLIIK